MAQGKKDHQTENGEENGDNVSFAPIRGIDTVKGIAMTGGTTEGYRQVLSMFRRDAEDRLQKLRFFHYEGMSSAKLPEKHLSSFITQIHALNGALATIGAAQVSSEAALLETAGKDKALGKVHNNLPDFVEHLAELVANIQTVLAAMQEEDPSKSGGIGSIIQMFTRQKPYKTQTAGYSECISILCKLKAALNLQNILDIDKIMEELCQKPMNLKIKKIVEQISDQILMAEFESAITTINEFLDTSP